MKNSKRILFLIIVAISLETGAQVEPLIATKWHQKCVYNEDCPVNADGPCGHCVAGCVAVAVAQMFRYWEFPAQWKYENMPAILDNNSTELENKTTAKFIHEVGIITGTRYGAKSSSSGLEREKLIAIGYSSELKFIWDSDYKTEEWIALLKNELNHERPVLISGFEQDFWCFHQFLIDGYRGDFFHTVYGWEGEYWNGWYKLEDMPFGNIMSAAINLYPTGYNSVTRVKEVDRKELVYSQDRTAIIGKKGKTLIVFNVQGQVIVVRKIDSDYYRVEFRGGYFVRIL